MAAPLTTGAGARERDARRDAWLAQVGLEVLRFTGHRWWDVPAR